MQPYEPQEDTYLLLKNAKKYAKGDVLEMGTGIGLIAIEAGRYAKNVLAVDINTKAIAAAKKNAKGIPNIKFRTSNLFSKFKKTEKFDLMIFNPPYLPAPNLPEEQFAKDIALDGGRHGYEILGKFLDTAVPFLKKDGKILVIFSKLTKPEKVKEFIFKNCLTYKEIDSVKIPFEELYVWLIEKSKLLMKLENKNITNVKYFTKGHRGFIYQGKLEVKSDKKSTSTKSKTVMIKINNPASKATERIKNEVFYLKKIEKYHLAPKVLMHTDDYFVYEYIPGIFIREYIEKNTKTNIIKTLKNVFDMMYLFDKLKINKEEMHHPVRHIIIKNHDVKLIDFERANYAKTPKNVTQFCQFIISIQRELREKKIIIDMKKVIALGKKYKKEINEKNLEKIKGMLK